MTPLWGEHVGAVAPPGGLGKEGIKRSGLSLGQRGSDTRPGRRDAQGRGGLQTPLRPPHRAHLPSPVPLQPQEVLPAFSTDAIEDMAWVGALHERELPSDTQQEPELHQRDPSVPVLLRKGTRAV